MKCDVIANGVVNAAKKLGLKVPLVVRLEGSHLCLSLSSSPIPFHPTSPGTNVELGKQIMAASGLPIISASNLDDAAKKAVAAIKNL